MKDKLVLKDNTEIDLESSSTLSDLRTVFPDWPAVAEMMPRLTDANLAEVSVKTAEGLTVGTYKDLTIAPGGYDVMAAGIAIRISLREKSDVEKRLDNLEEGQQIQDGAIEDLGTMTSVIAGQLEGGA